MLEIFGILNIAFNAIFTIEAIIKIVALRSRYFKDTWNVFDFTIVALTYVFLVLSKTNVIEGFGSTTTILRALRIGRVLRLIKKAQKLQIIFYSIIDSLATLGSLGLLLLLFFFMFAVIGTSNFGKVMIGEP